MPIYMKVPGITGTSKRRYYGWIVLESCQWMVNQQIVVTKNLDIASTGLFQLSLTGEGKKITIDFVSAQNEGVPYFSIELENTLISSYSVSGTGGGANNLPMESLALNYTKITSSTSSVSASKDAKALKDKAMWDLAIGTSASGAMRALSS